jgi:RasGEF domain
LAPKALKQFSELSSLLSSQRNFQLYRKALSDTHGAAVPHIGVSLMDLVYLDESRSSYGAGSKGAMVDYTKMVETSYLLQEFISLQEKEVDCSVRNRYLSSLLTISAPSMEALVQLSHKTETEDPSAVRVTFQHNFTFAHPIYSALEAVPTGQANLTNRDFKLFLTGMYGDGV